MSDRCVFQRDFRILIKLLRLMLLAEEVLPLKM